MNKVILMGRLTKDPSIYANAEMLIAKYSLAVDRRREDGADFINITVFGKAAEFAEKYLHKGTKILVTGRIQTGSYTNRDGVKVYTTEVTGEDQEFAESKSHNSDSQDGFKNIPEGIDEDLPFAQPTR